MIRRTLWPLPAAALLAAGCLTMAHLRLARPVLHLSPVWPHLSALTAEDDNGFYMQKIEYGSDLYRVGFPERPAWLCSYENGPTYPARTDGWCYAEDAPR